MLFMEQANDKLISIEIKDSIGSIHLGVHDSHLWIVAHLDIDLECLNRNISLQNSNQNIEVK